jgi:cephalosporin hydroxylase
MIVIENDLVKVTNGSEKSEFPIGSPEAFKIISDLWLRSGWDTKYVYSFAWMGRPVIQLPEDMLRIQEVIFDIQPDVIIETGVAHGGSLIYYASLCKAMEKGRVIGIDIEIRQHNRKAIEDHFLFPYIELIEESSTDADIIRQVQGRIQPGEKVLVLLDSNHSYDHVYRELELYSQMVTVGSYIVATDGIMEYLVGAPRSADDWATNNPKKAAEDFVASHPDYIIEEPAFPFNEGAIRERVTYWPSAYIKRIR